MRFKILVPEHKPYDESAGTLKVVRAAKAVFLASGGAAFSIRGVAKQAGMSMGAVQHFYPTRDQLVAAVLEYVTNEYEAAWEAALREFPFNGEDRLMRAVEHLANDITLPETRQFFFALWALSCHNKFAAKLQEEMYSHHTRNVASFVGAARPEYSERQCLDAAILIVALTDGLMLYTAPGAKHFSSRAALIRAVKRSVIRILSLDKPQDSLIDATEPSSRDRPAAANS